MLGSREGIHEVCASYLIRQVTITTHYESFSPRYVGLHHAEGAYTRFMVASGGGLTEGYGHDGPGVSLGDGQTEAYLKDTGMTGMEPVWEMARRRPV